MSILEVFSQITGSTPPVAAECCFIMVLYSEQQNWQNGLDFIPVAANDKLKNELFAAYQKNLDMHEFLFCVRIDFALVLERDKAITFIEFANMEFMTKYFTDNKDLLRMIDQLHDKYKSDKYPWTNVLFEFWTFIRSRNSPAHGQKFLELHSEYIHGAIALPAFKTQILPRL
jgi:hypothetical protein